MRLQITTFNVGLFDIQALRQTIFEFSPYTRLRANALPSLLKDHDTDILCLQELYHSPDYELVAEALFETYRFSFRTPCNRLGVLNTGLAIFSKLPLLKCDERVFGAQTLDEGLFAKKGFQIFSVELVPDNLTLVIANVHTTAGGVFKLPNHPDASKVRQRQLAELVSVLRAQVMPYWMIAGDLNCSPEISSENYNSLVIALNAVDPCARASRSDQDFITWDPNNPLNKFSRHRSLPPQRIDHILISELLADHFSLSARRVFLEPVVRVPRTVPYVSVSDHFGLQVTIE